MKTGTGLLAVALVTLASALPTPIIERASMCGQYTSATTGAYIINNDLWQEAEAASGSQCTILTGLDGEVVQWYTTWSWEGSDHEVKSYAHAALSFDSKQLAAITSMESTWTWSYIGKDLVANTAYDMYTSPTTNGTHEYEVMIWLADLGGANPIAESYSLSGAPVAISSTTIGGKTYNLYKGPNGDTTVYSFVATDENTDFSGDVKDFFDHLIDDEGFPSSQYLLTVSAGTETFMGSDAEFKITGWSLNVSA